MTPTLTVKDFSCIANATLSLSRMTVLIGPQGGGKSVISKLLYFCQDVLNDYFDSIQNLDSLEQYTGRLSDKFRRWFPPSAWGAKKFSISYTFNLFEITITRKRSTDRLNDVINITFSDSFSSEYQSLLNSINAAISESDKEDADADYHSFDISYRIRRASRARWDQLFGKPFTQTFIPAGRSFFTSVGKAVAAFENGGVLDPLTLEFGRLFTALRDEERSPRLRGPNARKSTLPASHQKLMRRIFGGEIKFDRDREYVETPDGRHLSFSILSSGQQELLPLWLVIGYVAQLRFGEKLVYIEEPEAHLFPSAQNILMEYLSTIVGMSELSNSMLITTHSPYLLSKLNNLIKAGNLASSASRQIQSKISAITEKDAWITSDAVAAYALDGGKLVRILDSDGLINASYLDGASEQISQEFNGLLEIEFSQ